MVTQLIAFNREPAPIRNTVTKTIAEFRRTHSDTWSFQKTAFSDEQLEVYSKTKRTYFYAAIKIEAKHVCALSFESR